MCGRFAVTLPPDAMARLFNAAPANDLPEVPNYNVCPTDQVHVVVPGDGQRRLVSMRWGFLPSWYKTPSGGPLLINARSETIADKPAFRSAVRARRCLVPASGFFEWTKDAENRRLPWFIQRTDGAPMAFAGIWQNWRQGDSQLATCAIVTTAANRTMSQIHSRVPVVLDTGDWATWLGETDAPAATLMGAGPEDRLRFHRVDPRVNSNRASGADLIEPVAA